MGYAPRSAHRAPYYRRDSLPTAGQLAGGPNGAPSSFSQRKETENMTDQGGIAGERLQSFIERVERMEEERAGIAADIREIYAEAKGDGFDTKVMRQVVRLRRMDQYERAEADALLHTYCRAIGMPMQRDLFSHPTVAVPLGTHPAASNGAEQRVEHEPEAA